MSNKKFKLPNTGNKSLSPKLVWYNSRIKLKFKGSCLKQEYWTAYTSKNVVNFFIVYELDSWPRNFDTDFTLSGCLFGSVKLNKNVDPGKYSYRGYGIGFYTRWKYSLPDVSVDENSIIFGVDMSSSMHIDKSIFS